MLNEEQLDADYFDAPAPRREFEAGIDAKIRTLKLIKSGRWPESIQGFAVVTTALWLLRTVYGDDLSSAAAIRKIALGKVAEEQAEEMDRSAR